MASNDENGFRKMLAKISEQKGPLSLEKGKSLFGNKTNRGFASSLAAAARFFSRKKDFEAVEVIKRGFTDRNGKFPWSK